MSYTVENLENSMAKLIITVGAEEFEKAMQRSYNKNKGRINIQGFRRGKAPRKMIEKMYGPEVFYEDAANFVIPDAYEEASRECDLDIVSRPDIDVVDMEVGKDFVFSATVAVRPDITLGEYQGIEVQKREVEVTPEDVDAELDRVREQNSRMITVEDGEVAEGDTAVIDFEGFIDGKAFQGGKGESYELVIGSHSFIDNFEDQLIGAKAGDEKEVNVTFPENYQEVALQGKPALFQVKVKEIRRKEQPELDDEFASDVSEFETLEEYKESIRNDLKERREASVKREKENEAAEKLANSSTVELPAPMVDDMVYQMAQDFAYRIQQQGLSFDQYMQMTGMTRDSLMAQMRPDAEKRITTTLALEKLAEVENLEVTDEDIEKGYQDLAAMYMTDAEEMKKTMEEERRKDMIRDLKIQKALDYLAEHSVEVENAKEEEQED